MFFLLFQLYISQLLISKKIKKMNKEKTWNKKIKGTIIKSILFTLLIEFIIAFIIWGFIYKDYKKISAAQSGIAKSSKLNNIKIKKIDITFKNKENNKTNKKYSWVLWKISNKETEVNNKWSKNIISIDYTNKIDITLYKSNIKLFLILQTLNKNKVLDKYIYAYLYNKYMIKPGKSIKNHILISETINRILKYAITLNYINLDKAKKIQSDINTNIDNIFKQIKNDIKNKDYKDLSKLLYSIENIKDIPQNIYWNIDLIKNQKFQYIINKLLSNSYYYNIEEASRKTWIDKKLIISAIAVEQLRYLNSNRAFAKKLLMQNKFLTNFSQFSYWLGWIKVNTFININKRLKQYEPYIYNKYFLYYDNFSKKTDDEINTLKESWDLSNNQSLNNNQDLYNTDKIINLLKKHDVAALYVAWLLLSIKDKRENGWINIYNKPWIMLTLYNMGNTKTPHKDPWIGGSLIPVSKTEKKYFWEIWSIFYNYIDFYLNLK